MQIQPKIGAIHTTVAKTDSGTQLSLHVARNNTQCVAEQWYFDELMNNKYTSDTGRNGDKYKF